MISQAGIAVAGMMNQIVRSCFATGTRGLERVILRKLVIEGRGRGKKGIRLQVRMLALW